MALIKRERPTTNENKRRCDRDLAALLVQLNSVDAAERRWAARDLATYPESVGALCQLLATEEEEAVRAALFHSLVEIGNEEATTGLIALLRSEDASLRNGSIASLKCLPDRFRLYSEALLCDGDPDVRMFTVIILAGLPHTDVPRILLEHIAVEREANVCAAALDALAEMADSDMIPALTALKGRFADIPFITFAVDLILERIRSDQIKE
jgi:HEAT repeat protein